MNAPIKTSRLLLPSEVAELFRVDAKTVTRWANAGKISSIRTLGGHRRFREEDVHALLADTGITTETDTNEQDETSMTDPDQAAAQ